MTELSKKIKPLIVHTTGYYILHDEISADESFLWHREKAIHFKGQISIICKKYTYHTFGYKGFFKPTMEECLKPFPSKYLEFLDYFSVEGPKDIHDLNLEPELLDKDLHKAVTTYYCLGDFNERYLNSSFGEINSPSSSS